MFCWKNVGSFCNAFCDKDSKSVTMTPTIMPKPRTRMDTWTLLSGMLCRQHKNINTFWLKKKGILSGPMQMMWNAGKNALMPYQKKRKPRSSNQGPLSQSLDTVEYQWPEKAPTGCTYVQASRPLLFTYKIRTFFTHCKSNEPCHEKRAIITCVNSKGSGQPVHPHSLARTDALRSSKK